MRRLGLPWGRLGAVTVLAAVAIGNLVLVGDRPPGDAGRASATQGRDLRLFLPRPADGVVTVVDAERRRVGELAVPQLAPGRPPPGLIATGGGLVAYGADARGPGAYRVDPRGRAPARRLGFARHLVPSATPGRVWLTGAAGRGPAAVREVTLDGRVTVPRGPRPPRGPILAATARGLVIGGDGLTLWDPVSGAVRRRLPGRFLLAARGARVALCARACPGVVIADVVTGRRRSAGPPAGHRFTPTGRGVFSPDGRLLAVPVRAREDGRRFAGLVHVASGRAAAIRRLPLRGPAWALTWAPEGRLLLTAAEGAPLRSLDVDRARVRVVLRRLRHPVAGMVALRVAAPVP